MAALCEYRTHSTKSGRMAGTALQHVHHQIRPCTFSPHSPNSQQASANPTINKQALSNPDTTSPASLADGVMPPSVGVSGLGMGMGMPSFGPGMFMANSLAVGLMAQQQHEGSGGCGPRGG